MNTIFHIESFEELFVDVQMSKIFTDSKTFADAIPKFSTNEILEKYKLEKSQNDFSILTFITKNFVLPTSISNGFVSNTKHTAETHINILWDVLTKTASTMLGTQLQLPYKFIVPGGRFRELFYWDSYFTMLGLQISGRLGLIENMIDNFAFLIDAYGHIPNGNRTYLLSRSQPPFFSLMIELLSEEKGDTVYKKYMPQLTAEYEFWMKGQQLLTKENNKQDRVVLLKDGEILNRYWDDMNTPRAEGYHEDVNGLKDADKDAQQNFYRNVRAACESGWDFSGRWFADGEHIETIHTTNIIPVDLNCLLWHLETTLAKCNDIIGDFITAKNYNQKASKRTDAIQKYLWNENAKIFFDYNIVLQKSSPYLSMASAFPLFIKIASMHQGECVIATLKTDFLQSGGLLTSTKNSGQQWDAPNGWAPLQWIGYKAAINYGDTETATAIKQNWINNVERVYRASGKMMEKYNVLDTNSSAGGGEYENQDGFGWTNGVYLRLLHDKNDCKPIALIHQTST